MSIKKLWEEFLVEIKDKFDDFEYAFPVCGLCGNTGLVSTKCKSPAGIPVQMDSRPCICPNGRSIKKHINKGTLKKEREKEKQMEKET